MVIPSSIAPYTPAVFQRMYFRLAKRLLLETDKRLLWKLVWLAGVKGVRSIHRHKRRLRRGDFLPVRPGIGLIAATSGAPVIPTYIQGFNKLWNCILGKEKAVIIYGTPLTTDRLAAFGRDKEGYRMLAEEIMGQIRGLKEAYIKSTMNS